MKNAMTYKGYVARVEFDPKDRIFFGRLAGIRDIISFHGETVDELETAFKEAVDHYLDTCAELGEKPNKPYSGKLTLRISPSIHAAIATAAETSGKSLNKWVADTLDQVIHAQQLHRASCDRQYGVSVYGGRLQLIYSQDFLSFRSLDNSILHDF